MLAAAVTGILAAVSWSWQGHLSQLSRLMSHILVSFIGNHLKYCVHIRVRKWVPCYASANDIFVLGVWYVGIIRHVTNTGMTV